jgi:hypothetical protein
VPAKIKMSIQFGRTEQNAEAPQILITLPEYIPKLSHTEEEKCGLSQENRYSTETDLNMPKCWN